VDGRDKPGHDALSKRRLVRIAGRTVTIIVVAIGTFATWVVSLGPLPLAQARQVSTTIVDRNGKLLRAYAMADGRWRLPVDARTGVDPGYLKLLLAYEDRRFYSHEGVDPLALGRAAFQLVSRGHIVSGGSTITMQLMIDDMENLRKQLKIERWIILGHSFGGMLASYYATIHPDKIISLILSSSGGIDLELLSYVSKNINAKLTPQQLDSANYWSQKIADGDTSYFARCQRAKALANAYVYHKKYAPAIAERLTHSNLRINDLIWQDMQKINFNCAAKLLTFTRPVLIIQGRQDIIEERTSQKASRIFKNSRLVILDHCVHYGWLDNRDAYLSEVEKFISEN
jgi:proline iminopeptidase